MDILRKLILIYIGLFIVLLAMSSSAGTILLVFGVITFVFAIPFIKGYRRARKQEVLPFS